MKLPTFSKIGRAMACPASELLPRIRRSTGPEAKAGKADHAELYQAIENGKPASFDTKPLMTWLKLCEAIESSKPASFDTGPLIDWLKEIGDPRGELALAYDPDTEKSIELGCNIDREYEAHGADMGVQFCGALDGCSWNAKIARIVDLKTGRLDGDLWQLKSQAVALSRLARVEEVQAAFWYIPRDGGEQSRQVFTWSTMDLDGFAEEMAQLKSKIWRWRNLSVKPDELKMNEGDHCTYCEAYAACPAKVGLARVLGAEASAVGTVLGDEIATLTPVEAGIAWERLIKSEALLKHVREGLEGYARQVPLELADGRVVRPVPSKREYINGKVAYSVIARLYGAEQAEAACPPSCSKEALKKTLGAVEAKEAVAAIGEAGGIEVKEYETIKAVKQSESGGR